MHDTVIELVERGRSLSPQERELLVELLLATLVEPAEPEIEGAWNREIKRRIEAHKRGESETFSLEDVLAEARLIAP
jgi:putative addiction module component (TIGR02574 family)